MTTFTIDRENNITAFGTPEEAAATTTTPFDTFASQEQLAELADAWPADRLVAIWNSLAGVVPVESFKSPKTAISRIWARIQGLGEAAKPKAEVAKPKADKKAKGGAQAAKGAPAKAKATKKTTAAKNAPKGKTAVKAPKATKPKAEGVREGSKTSAILDLLRRAKGATLSEIMEATSWQAHSVRGFISGTLGKKMGLSVKSEKREDGTRVYSIAK